MKPPDSNGVERLRLFVAADVPDEQLVHIGAEMDKLRSEFPSARWSAPENQHVTLKFLGSTLTDRFESILEACRLVARSHHPASVTLTNVGSFPSAKRSRVLWIGIDDPGQLLTKIAADLDRAFEPLGFAAEERAFTPHLTLCRFKVPVRLPDGPPVIDLIDLGSFDVSRFVLYRSYLSPKGARYEALENFPLG